MAGTAAVYGWLHCRADYDHIICAAVQKYNVKCTAAFVCKMPFHTSEAIWYNNNSVMILLDFLILATCRLWCSTAGGVSPDLLTLGSLKATLSFLCVAAGIWNISRSISCVRGVYTEYLLCACNAPRVCVVIKGIHSGGHAVMAATSGCVAVCWRTGKAWADVCA